MRNIFKVFFLIFCLLINTHTLIGNNAKPDIDHILVINTYADSNPWSNSLINPILDMASKNNKIGVVTAHLKMLAVDNQDDLKKIKESLFQKLPSRTPKVIVMIGCASYILCDELNNQWPDVPMLLCGERDYTGPEELITSGEPITPEQRIPVSSLHKKFNLTFMYAHNYLEENIQLMKQLIPQLEKIIYIGDRTYICQQNNYDLSEVLQKKYPELKYKYISAENTSTDSLFTMLNHQNQQSTGVLFTSWMRKQDYTDNLVMTTNSHRIIATVSIPLFSFRTVGIKEEGGIVGGYVYNEKRYISQLLTNIDDIINGKPARDIPFYQIDNGAPVFNYQSLLQRNLDPSRCPQSTIFFNAPPTFWEQYEYIVIGGLCLLILILLFFQYNRVRVLLKMKHIQQNELRTVGKYYNLINNMPILYMLEELIMDKDGRIIETRFADVNKRFEDKFCNRKDIIGKSDLELFPDSTAQFHHFMNIALKEKRSITFSYYNKEVDTFYDVLVNLNGDERFMDVFCMDSTELHHTQEQLRSINHKLSMALDVANIVPWKWDLKNHTILCDVNKPIELSNNNEISDEQLSVPDNEYFSKIYKEDLPKVKEAFANLLAGRSQKVKEEYRVVNRINGCKHIDWVEAQAAVESYDEKGQPLTLVGSSLVISERKKMESDLISAKNRAEESNRLKSAFLANMSHEIRTPLNAIVGFSGILASTEEEEEKMEYVSIIENNNTLLLQLISDILDLSKIEAGTMEFIDTDFELNKVMWELENSLRLKLPADKDLILVFEQSLPELKIHAERNRISQIIINLVTNAIKFTESGSIRFGYEKRNKMIYPLAELKR